MRRLAVAALLCAAALAAGCAAPGRPPLTASPDVGPNFAVPDERSRMVYLARQEWALFGRPVVIENGTGDPLLAFDEGSATHEAQAPMLARVLMYWYGVSRLPIVGHQGELRPWSAAFISWVAKSAGLGPDEFPPTVLHWNYIERFFAADGTGRFAARDPVRYAPRVGDLVCNARGGTSADFFEPAPRRVSLRSRRRGARRRARRDRRQRRRRGRAHTARHRRAGPARAAPAPAVGRGDRAARGRVTSTPPPSTSRRGCLRD
ncbi:MAG: DUF2272 domain-containing protein [Burkholderiales bacterium]|nr:DUF2272 domain-containing protein [Burkholderiales bacterium]